MPVSEYRCRFLLLGICSLALAISVPVSAGADSTQLPRWSHSLSLQGFTGLLNTPSAYLQETGTLEGQYTNQVDSHWNRRHRMQDNYLFSVGLFGFAEIGGRLTETFSPRGTNDLSAQAKLSTAFLTRERPWFPVLAIGMQDISGGARNLQSRYAVVSSEIWRLRLSAGYGHGPDRMKGGFGGGELVLHDWVRLLAEYDTRDTNVGVRLNTPRLPYVPIRLTATGTTAVSGSRSGSFSFAAGFSIPLDLKEWNRSTPDREATASEQPLTVASDPIPILPPATGLSPEQQAAAVSSRLPGPAPVIPSPSSAAAAGLTDDLLLQLRQRLEDAGMIRVQVGRGSDGALVIRYENVAYQYNELDALGIVTGLAATLAPADCELLTVVTLRKGIAMQQLQLPVALLRAYFDPQGGGRSMLAELRDTIRISADTDLDGVEYLAAAPSAGLLSYLPPVNVAIAPGLTTFVGTDYGVFDYLLSLKPEVTINPWPGGQLHARWDLPIAWSENLDAGKPYRSWRKNPVMDRLMLYQAIKPVSSVMLQVAGGMVQHDLYGTVNELIWQPGDGTHRFRVMQGWGQHDRTGAAQQSWLGSYRYHLAPADLWLEATGGRFWYNDTGYSLEMKRFFGDVAVSLLYKNATTAATTVPGKHWQMAGVQFSLPLTTRKNLKVGPVVVGGSDEWGYIQETTLAIGGQKSNDVLSVPLATQPLTSPALGRSYYNRDRLQADYLRRHLDRLREAWLRFGQAD